MFKDPEIAAMYEVLSEHTVRGSSCFETFIVQTDNAARVGGETKGQRRQTASPHSHIKVESQPGAEPRLSDSVQCHSSEDPNLKLFRCH